MGFSTVHVPACSSSSGTANFSMRLDRIDAVGVSPCSPASAARVALWSPSDTVLLSSGQHEPQDGPYCIYHQRQPGDLNYNYTHEASRCQADISQFCRLLLYLYMCTCAHAQDATLSRCVFTTMQGAYQTYTDQPDCPGYQDLLRRHALQLVATGVDHVLVPASACPPLHASRTFAASVHQALWSICCGCI